MKTQDQKSRPTKTQSNKTQDQKFKTNENPIPDKTEDQGKLKIRQRLKVNQNSSQQPVKSLELIKESRITGPNKISPQKKIGY